MVYEYSPRLDLLQESLEEALRRRLALRTQKQILMDQEPPRVAKEKIFLNQLACIASLNQGKPCELDMEKPAFLPLRYKAFGLFGR